PHCLVLLVYYARWLMTDTLLETEPIASPEHSARPRTTTRRAERIALIALFAAYLVSACGFAFATPYGEAPDEYAHLGYVEYLVVFSRLPAIERQPYTNESF